MNVIAKLLNLLKNGRVVKVPFDEVPKRDFLTATRSPWFRQKLIETAIVEDEEGSYFHGMLNILADHTIGPFPHILGDHPNEQACDEIEDRWAGWCMKNAIGKALRQMRRNAARTGLGIGIPYKKNDSKDPVSLAIKVVCASNLETPMGQGFRDRIIDGIEYDENWDIKKLYFKDGSEYDAKDILLWYKHDYDGIFRLVPECGPALCLFPSVKRVIDAIVRRHEFRSSVPMAVELDPLIYKPEDATNVPKGAFKYEAGMVPTLPPGTKLTGLPAGADAKNDSDFIKLVVSSAARCFTMPANLVFGSSADSNMASSQVDMIPWENKITIDRSDFLPVVVQLYNLWSSRAVLVEDYMSPRSRNVLPKFNFSVNYSDVFRHPDPVKNANSKLIDMIAGTNTLYRTCTDAGLNPRRERKREAALLGVTVEQLNQHYLAARTNLSQVILKGMQDEEETQPEEQ